MSWVEENTNTKEAVHNLWTSISGRDNILVNRSGQIYRRPVPNDKLVAR